MAEFIVKGALFTPVISLDVDGTLSFDVDDSFRCLYDEDGDANYSPGEDGKLPERLDAILTPPGEIWDEVSALRRMADYIERRRKEAVNG